MKAKRSIILLLVLSIVMSVFSIIPASASSGVNITYPGSGNTINNTKYEIRFTWDNDLSATSYYLVTLQNLTTGTYYLKSTRISSDYYNIPSRVLAAGKYKFKVIAYDSDGDSIDSDYITFYVTR